MAKKNTPTVTSITSFEQADAKLLEVASFEAIIKQEEARMNKRMQEIRDQYETNTADARAKKSALEKEIELFCISNKQEFTKQRSKELTHGTLGFRYNPPKVSLLNRKYNWGTVIELLKRLFDDAYVRTKEEPNKDAILADYAAKTLTDEKLASVGIKIDQEEEFYCDIKWEQIDKEAA